MSHSFVDIIDQLHELKDPEKVIFKEKKFAVVSHNALGVYHKDLKRIAKDIGHNNQLALQLFDSGIYEGRLLCSKLHKPKELTEGLIEKWVKTFENWEICDSFCMGLIVKSQFAVPKILEWTKREPEFEKRAGFATMAAYCMADKKAPNSVFESFLPIIMAASNDHRLYVKKAVNWALRNIGKRNVDLKHSAIETANEILQLGTNSATWIAKDALRELQGENARSSDYPRAIYRPS